MNLKMPKMMKKTVVFWLYFQGLGERLNKCDIWKFCQSPHHPDSRKIAKTFAPRVVRLRSTATTEKAHLSLQICSTTTKPVFLISANNGLQIVNLGVHALCFLFVLRHSETGAKIMIFVGKASYSVLNHQKSRWQYFTACVTANLLQHTARKELSMSSLASEKLSCFHENTNCLTMPLDFTCTPSRKVCFFTINKNGTMFYATTWKK